MSMIRPNIPSDFNPSTSDLIFQVVDWKSCDVPNEKVSEWDEEEEEDEEEEVPKKKMGNKKELLIRGYGVTENGNSICVHIHNFQPYFYFKIPDEWTQIEFNAFRDTVKMMVEEYNRNGLVSASIVEKKEFYGFTNNELFKYGVFIFKNQASYYSYQRIFKEKTIVMRRYNVELDMSKKLYETKVSSLLRFFHVRNLDPSGWCCVRAGQYKLNVSKSEKVTRCQLDITTTFDKMEKIDKSSIGKLVIASFDLECSSEDGTFPKPERPYDQVIQIGTTVYVFGNPECQIKYIATLKRCLPIEGAHVESYETERDMILGWSQFMASLDPDIITGYNIWGFDWEFLYKRAEYGFQQDVKKPQVPFHQILYRNLQRIRPLKTHYNMDDGSDPNVKLTIQNLSSSALGDNFLKFIDIEGVVQIDLLKVVQRDHKLDSYKLDNVAKHFMKQQKVDLSPNELFRNFREGTPEKIQEIAIYCIMDCKLVNELINKLDVITANMGMSNVCVVPFSYLFLRGQGIKIFSLVAKFCREENFLIKDLSDEDIDKNSYEGAIVFPPKPGVYFEPVVVMDYNSLYPSSMIAENISHDSIVGFQEYHIKPGMKGDKPEDYELIKDTMNYKYDGLAGYHYIDIEYDLFREDESGATTRDENGKKESKKKKFGYKKCRFAEADNMDKSVLPRILRTLLKARKDTRKKMEYVTHTMKDGSLEIGIPTELPDGRIELFHVEKGKYCIQKEDVVNTEDTYNDFEQSVLDGLQLAYKVTCNSLYGQVGATTSPICYKELAACTTATGRKMVVTARDLTLQTFEGSKLVYGDSVTGDTPILLRNKMTKEVYAKSIADLGGEWSEYGMFKPEDSTLRNKEQSAYDAEIWTAHGWADIKKVIRHMTKKKIYRVLTHTGCVDVTEDHSLLDEDLNEVKPKDVNVGMKLKHFSPFGHMRDEDYDAFDFDIMTLDLLEMSKEEIQNIVIEMRKMKKYFLFEKTDDPYKIMMKFGSYKFYEGDPRNEIIQITELRETDENEYVYDIETSDGTFQAGIGQMIVKNTDSVFINFTDHIKMNNPDKELTENDLLVESIQMGVKAAKNINSHMKAPQNIEYEKTLWPFCIFSKKRYFGNLYEHDPKKYKPKYMGIVLKRRDNAPIVKTIYGGVLDKILNGARSVDDSIRFFRSSIQDLLDGKVNISQLVISKTLKAEYANPTQIAHKVLADRMGERDPGNKPQSNDRIPYCYIDSSNLKCMICKGAVNVEKCKCVGCMQMFCSTHLVRHKEKCVKVCRFCKLNEKESKLVKCNTCLAYYCGKCNTKHKTRVDGKTGQTHTDKCKKALPTKILQGDILEHPQYIQEAGLKIDYRYYFDHQIWEPVRQIFALVSDNPDSIVADILRKNDNAKKGNYEITAWFAKMKQMGSPVASAPVEENPKVEEVKEEITKSTADEKVLTGILPEKKMKKIEMKIDSKFDVKCDLNAPFDGDDEEADMLDGEFEEEHDSDMEGMELDECAFDMES